jgi:two-component system response regulator EvgA
VASRIGKRSSLGEDVAVHVLIVDDHSSFRATARRLLEDEGYEIVGEAENAAAALTAAQKTHPDLVLLDVQLPDLDGFALAERLSALDPGMQIVLTSSRDAKDYGPRLETSAARGFVPKAELSGATLAALLE